jgi:hypothetical protein
MRVNASGPVIHQILDVSQRQLADALENISISPDRSVKDTHDKTNGSTQKRSTADTTHTLRARSVEFSDPLVYDTPLPDNLQAILSVETQQDDDDMAARGAHYPTPKTRSATRKRVDPMPSFRTGTADTRLPDRHADSRIPTDDSDRLTPFATSTIREIDSLVRDWADYRDGEIVAQNQHLQKLITGSFNSLNKAIRMLDRITPEDYEDTEFLSEQTEFVMSYMRRSKSMLMEALGQTAGKLDV